MMINLFYIILAILGLSFLIFIHELGHYWMARRVGMRVETFAIGFGKPIYSWERDGVRWQIGWLLFGGYVKIAGADPDKGEESYQRPDGFYAKKPQDRIKVAVMGPLVNIVAAFLIFALLWALGGREEKFSSFTAKIGWIDPQSEIYKKGVRPGDEINGYNHKNYEGVKDHIYAPTTASGAILVTGNKIDYSTGKRTPFEINVTPYHHPAFVDKGLMTAGILQPASYLLYDRIGKEENPLPKGSPLEGSGIQYGDRIVWVDGELIFSVEQLHHLLNSQKALLTIEREGKLLQIKVPRVQLLELKLDRFSRDELLDWQYEARLNSIKFPNLFYIPYAISPEGIVEASLKFIDEENRRDAFPHHPLSASDLPLEVGDQIIAVDGVQIKQAYELLQLLQKNYVNIIVQRGLQTHQSIPWSGADSRFDEELKGKELQKLASSIGTSHPVTHQGNFYLLKRVIPKTWREFNLPEETKELLVNQTLQAQKEIEEIEDLDKREQALRLLEARDKQLLLGLPDQDRTLLYNPSPIKLFGSVFSEIWNVLTALVSGGLNPKLLQGPVGIVQMIHRTSMVSLKESLYWLGAISLNLGILNLLPIPVLDGGTILISLYEWVTKKRVQPKVIEKLVIPFAILLIGFFIFLTYHDLVRILGRLWG